MSEAIPTILIVDDEMHVRLVVKAYLAPYDVKIQEATNGKEGLEIMRAGGIDLVILDNNMPIMTGQEVLSHMVSEGGLKNIPIIMYTAGGFEKETENRLKSASSAFLEKTSLGDDLIPTIEEILGPRLIKKST